MNYLSLSRWALRLAIPLAGFPVIFAAQLLVGREASLFPLYLIPVVHTAWEFGPRWATLAVLVAVGLWISASLLNGDVYSAEWIRYYNGLARGIIYGLGAWCILLFKRTLNTHRERMEAMRSLLNVCHGCGSVQGSDGQWIPMHQLTGRTRSGICECPECSERTKSEPTLQR